MAILLAVLPACVYIFLGTTLQPHADAQTVHTAARRSQLSETRAKRAAGVPHVEYEYCIIYTEDLITPHGRCYNQTLETSSADQPEFDEGLISEDDDDVETLRSYLRSLQRPSFRTLYPCIPMKLRFGSAKEREQQTELGDEEWNHSILVLRGEHTESKNTAASSPKEKRGDAELKQRFLAQHHRLTAPKRIFPSDIDANVSFQTPTEEGPPKIESQDLLLFHDRLSWTLFVQSTSSADPSRCPFDTTPYGGDFMNGRRPTPNEPEGRDVCLTHHELLYGRMQLTSKQQPSSGDQSYLHTCAACDGRADSEALLVPRALFHSTVSPLTCLPSVHSTMDLLLAIQDYNEQRLNHLRSRVRLLEKQAEQRKADEDAQLQAYGASEAETDSPPPSPSKAATLFSTLWNTLSYHGAPLWNSDAAFWIIDSTRTFVEPTSYVSERAIRSGDEHERYPPLPPSNTFSPHVALSASGVELPERMVRVVCCSAGVELFVPPRPGLPAHTPALTQLHSGFPLHLSPSSGRFNKSVLSTFLQPQRHIRTRSYRPESSFHGWVDVQQQGRFICPGCVLRWDYCRYVAGKDGSGGSNKTGWAKHEYFSCALAGREKETEQTEKGLYVEERGYIGRVDLTPYTSLEVEAAIKRRRIRRIVYSDGHVSWHGCTTSSALCCQVRDPLYPLGCRTVRKDALWIQTAPCCHKQYIAMYHLLVTMFEEHQVEWALGFGTLLTALRSDGAANVYDYDADFLVYEKGFAQIRALIPVLEAAGLVVIPNQRADCEGDCELYRILWISPDHLHQSTIDIFLQNAFDEPIHPFNSTTTFLHRPARIPWNAEKYLDDRYRGWKETVVLTVENWLPDPATGKKPPFLLSSFYRSSREFNRTLEYVTLPAWAKKLHVYAEWDLGHGGIDRHDKRPPTVEIVWRPDQMRLK